jgi:hypothetical protein
MIPNLNSLARLAFDGWSESEHPRASNGQFGSGGGSGPKMRDYAPKELDWEYDVEYGKYSKHAFPDAFKSRDDFQQKFDAAPMRPLTEAEFRGLGNSMAAAGIGKNEKWVHENFSHRRDSRRIIDALKNGETAPPIVLKSGKRLRLMAGQTRLAAGAALGMSVPVKIIDVGPGGQASDEADFKESQHPRDKDGKFTSGGGSSGTGPSNMNKPVQVSTTIGQPLSKAGFKKVKQPGPNGSVTYFHPSGVKVHVHPAPEGKKYSSKWTHEAEGQQTAGEGSKLEQLLSKLVQKAEAAKPATSEKSGTPAEQAESALNKAGWENNSLLSTPMVAAYKNPNSDSTFYVNKVDGSWFKVLPTGKTVGGENLGELQAKLGQQKAELAPAPLDGATVAAVKASGEMLKDKGYKPLEVNGTTVIYEKNLPGQPGNGKVKYDAKTHEWVAQTHGHMTKEGKGLNELDLLLGGNGIPAGVKNSQQTIQTQAELAQQTEAQKKAQAAQKEHNTLKSTYHKLVAQAPHPTATQQNAISKYSGNGYHQWNDKLRHDPNFAKSDPLTKHLDDYLNNAVFEEDFTVTRKVDGDYAKILKSIIFEGTKFIDRGYISTSATGQWSGSFKFVISIKKGQRGAAIGKWSHHPSEDEVLLPRNSAFVVKSYDHGSGTVHVDLDQSHFEEMKKAA